MKKLVIALLFAAACGGDDPKLAPDGGAQPDGPPMPETTFTSYVIDLVQHQTADNTAARAYAEFSTLPDPDSDNSAAYAPLFQ